MDGDTNTSNASVRYWYFPLHYIYFFFQVKWYQSFSGNDKLKGLPMSLLWDFISNRYFILSWLEKSSKIQLSWLALFLSLRVKDNLRNQFQRHFPKTPVYQYFKDKKSQISSLHLLWKTHGHFYPNILLWTDGYWLLGS